MNEQAIKDSYSLFVQNGYKKSLDEYKNLLATNQDALNDSYNLFRGSGYGKSIDEFKTLMGLSESAAPMPSEQLKKKDISMESSSEDGSLASQGQSSFKLSPITTSAETTKVVTPPVIKQDIKVAYAKENEKAPQFKKGLELINKDLISGTEEYAVPLMNYHFGDLGFKFEESGMTGDWVIATAPNGKKEEFSLDNFFSSKDQAEADRLKKWIKENSVNINISEIERKRTAADYKIKNDEDLKKSVNIINSDLDSLVKEKESIQNEYESYIDLMKNLDKTPFELRDKNWTKQFDDAVNGKNKIIDKAKELDVRRQKVSNNQALLQSAAGSYFTMKGEQGEWYGNIGNMLLDAFAKVSSGLTDIVMTSLPKEFTIGNEVDYQKNYQKQIILSAKEKGITVPEFKTAKEYSDWYNSGSLSQDVKDEIKSKIYDTELKLTKYGNKGQEGLLDSIRKGNRIVFGDPNTTPEYTDLSKQGFWGGAIAGLIDFAPAMIGSPIQKAATMYAIANDNMNQQLENDPDFKNMSERDKMLVSLPFNLANSVLLEFGLNKIMGSQSILANIVSKSIAKVGTEATAYELKNVMRGEVNNLIGKGLVNLSKSALAGSELGVAISATNTGMEEIYNAYKGKKMFDTPESINDFIKETGLSAAQMAVGGIVLGIPNVLISSMSKGGYEGMDNNTFKLFEISAKNEDLQKTFVVNLKNQIANKEITKEQAIRLLNNYRNSVGLFKELPDGLDIESKKKAMNLLKEKRDIEQLTAGKDPALFKNQLERVKEINESLSKINEDAIQKQKTDAGVLRTEQSEMGLQEMGEGNKDKISQATESKILSTIDDTTTALERLPSEDKVNMTFTQEDGTETPIMGNEKMLSELYHEAIAIPEEERTPAQQSAIDAIDVSLKTDIEKELSPKVNVAPFFDTQINSVEDARALRESDKYKGFVKTLGDLASSLGLAHEVVDKIGGYKNDAGQDITEVSMLIHLPGATIEQAQEFSALAAALSPDVQEASIAAKYSTEGADNHNANEYEFQVPVEKVGETIKTLKEAGIQNFTADDKTGIITFVDVKEFADPNLSKKINELTKLLQDKNIEINEDTFEYRPIESRYIDKNRRREIIRKIETERSEARQSGSSLYDAINKAVQQDSTFHGKTTEEYRREGEPTGPVAGNRLFSKPLSAVKEIANRYYERVFGKPRPEYTGSRKLDEARAKYISDAFIAMKHDPTNPEVRAAYEALAKETIEQYKALLDAGYVIEVNNEEPYANSEDMVNDLRDNKRIKIFSTESGFGDNPITDEQRAENPLLAKSEFTDKNGHPLLINDLFRAVHDFFGHAELGNSFGPKGEENAWNVHVRMFSPLAARAMTTETRGQNSYVNFSGVNDQIKGLREQARQLRQDGASEEQVKPIVDKIYELGSFAEQKVGLLPEEFSNYDVNDTGEQKLNVPQGVNELMKTDTSVPSNLDKVYTFLDNIDKAISKQLGGGKLNDATRAIPLGTMQVIVKSLKALVKGGMMLQDAIKKVAADNNVSEQDVLSSLTIIDNMINNVSEGLSEAELPGYDRMMGEVEGIIKKSKQRGVDEAKMRDNVMKYVMGSKVYETATDVQREKLVRDVNKMFGVRERSAPTAEKLLGGIENISKITMKEKDLLKKQLRDLARGARDAKSAISKASNELTVAVKKLATSGSITAKQAANVLRKFDNTNLLSKESRDRFVEYMSNVFEDAEYSDNLSKAKSTRSEILSLSKNKEKNANLKELGKEFCKIDPSLVDDISIYNDIALKIKESLKGSKINRENVKFADIINIEDATEYISETIKKQEKTLRDFAAAEVQELMDIDPSDLSYDELKSLLEKDEPITKYKESIIRDTISRMFDINSSIIKKMVSTGIDAFSGEKVDFTKAQKDIVKKFMDMDLNRLDAKEALQAVDALSNFIQNKSTAKMDDITSRYQGRLNSDIVLKEGLVAVKLKKVFSENFARLLAEQTTNLPELFTRLFKGVNRGGLVEDYMGVTKLINGKSLAQSESNNIVRDYVKEFYSKKANGEDFNTAYNNIERGMAAFMLRNVIGTEEEINKEFQRRKNLIIESIEVLQNGNENEKSKAKIYKEAFDKILLSSKDLKDVESKTDKTNLEAIKFWIDQWAGKYDEVSDVSLNVYNKVLERDLNYTPDRFSLLSRESGEIELGNDESAFHKNNGTIYKKESSGLMTAVKPMKLPTNTKNGQASRYVDLSFDKNNSNAMYDALVDIKTASSIRQVEAFLNAPSFSKIIETPEDAKILKDRIQLYVSNIRNKNPYSNVDELSKTIRRLDKVAVFGVSQALGGIFQPIKQTIPVAINTVMNAGRLDLSTAFDKNKNNFIDKSGYAIANRGIESQAQVESINKLIDKAAETKGEKAMKFIEEANRKWLELFLVKPDVFIARASWMSYYEQSLEKQGITTKNIDYSTHELNEKAANYAQRMVDRQQNISDTDLSGKLFSEKNEIKNAFVKMLMPFASFRMNQSTRLANDLSTLGHWSVSTKEDKIIAARSLAGFATEMATFKIISGAIAVLIGTSVKKIMDKEEDDDERKKRVNNIMKGQVTGTVTDILSPLPVLDKPVQETFHLGLDKIQDILETPDESRVNIYDVKKEDYIKSLGLFGVTADRASQLYNLSVLSQTGKFKDDYNNDKWITKDDQKALGYLFVPALMSSVGLAPSEISTIVRTAVSDAKKSASSVEGGKSSEDLQEDKELKQQSEERKIQREDIRASKIEELESLKESNLSEAQVEEVDRQIEYLSMDDKERKKYNKENKLQEEYLLQGYSSQKEMKEKDPDLYEETFGEGSDYYEEHKDEKKIKSILREKRKKKW